MGKNCCFSGTYTDSNGKARYTNDHSSRIKDHQQDALKLSKSMGTNLVFDDLCRDKLISHV